MRADGQIDLAPRLYQLIGDLHAGRSGTDDQHSAIGQLLWIAVLRRMDLKNVGLLGDDGRDYRDLKRAGGGHDPLGFDDALRGGHRKAGTVRIATHLLHLDATADRGVEFLRVGLEVIGDLILADKGVRVARKLQPREAVVPCRAVCHQRIPAPAAPAFGDPAGIGAASYTCRRLMGGQSPSTRSSGQTLRKRS